MGRGRFCENPLVESALFSVTPVELQSAIEQCWCVLKGRGGTDSRSVRLLMFNRPSTQTILRTHAEIDPAQWKHEPS